VNRLLYGPSLPGEYYRHRGKKYRLHGASRRTLLLIRDIATDPACHSTRGLLQIRARIRLALLVPSPVTVSYLLDTAQETRVRRVCLWLLGRFGHPYATPSVLRYADHADFRVRRAAIRSLHRLHAWSELRRIATDHPDPRIRALATPTEPRPYADRLGAFVAGGKTLESSESDRHLVIAPNVKVGAGRPPKSRWQIRSVLRRIRRLVRRRRRAIRWSIYGNRLCRSGGTDR
jgi:hypothetical protein